MTDSNAWQWVWSVPSVRCSGTEEWYRGVEFSEVEGLVSSHTVIGVTGK
jgi:(2Fe-2S) ferredoxin